MEYNDNLVEVDLTVKDTLFKYNGATELHAATEVGAGDFSGTFLIIRYVADDLDLWPGDRISVTVNRKVKPKPLPEVSAGE